MAIPYNCLSNLRIVDSNPNNTVFDCGQGITLTVNAPIPNVFCLSLRQKQVPSADLPPRELDSTAEPLEFEAEKKSWLWKQGDVHLHLSTQGIELKRFGTVVVKTTATGLMTQAAGFVCELDTRAMGTADTWPMPRPHLQGAVAFCGTYGGVGGIAADGICCARADGLGTVSTLSPALDVLLVAGTPIETSSHISLLTGRVIPPPIWAYGLGLELVGNDSEASGLTRTRSQADALRAIGVAVDMLMPSDMLALDKHGRFALYTDGQALEDMDLHKHVASFRAAKYKILPQITASLARADTLASEWRARNWLQEDGADPLPNVFQPTVATQMNERLETVFRHGIDGTQLKDDARLESPKFAYAGWKKVVYASAMRWHGEGADRRCMVVAKHVLPTKSGALGVKLEADCTHFEGVRQWLETMLQSSHSGAVLFASRLHINGASDAMLQRLAPLAALMPMSWLGDAAAILNASQATQAAWKLWSNYRLKLLPYVAGIVEESSRNGLPALRSMRLAFPRDAVAGAHFAHQYLLGPSLLVAPCLHTEPDTTVWLPAGERWFHLPSGTKFEGGQAISIPVEAAGIAVFGREGHVLCLGPDVAGAPAINTIKPVSDAWLFGLPSFDPCVTGIRVKVMQMQGNAYIKGLEGTKVISVPGYTVSRRGAEVKVVKQR